MFLREKNLEIVCIKPPFSRNSGENEVGAAQHKKTTTATVLLQIQDRALLRKGFILFGFLACCWQPPQTNRIAEHRVPRLLGRAILLGTLLGTRVCTVALASGLVRALGCDGKRQIGSYWSVCLLKLLGPGWVDDKSRCTI